MPKPKDAHTPNVRGPAGRGVPEKDESADLVNDERSEAPHAPKTSGAPKRGKEPLVNPTADRNKEGPRMSGTTPRPTDKPIVGGSR
jgi:hypothetical protein